MDNKGRVTVVLHWDQRHHQDKQTAKGNDARSPNKRLAGERPALVIQTSLDKLGTLHSRRAFNQSDTLLTLKTHERTRRMANRTSIVFFFHLLPLDCFFLSTLLNFYF
jgi:hypothetical protein